MKGRVRSSLGSLVRILSQALEVRSWPVAAGQTSSSVCYISVGSEPFRDETHGKDSRCRQQIYDLPSTARKVSLRSIYSFTSPPEVRSDRLVRPRTALSKFRKFI